ncbi:YncE family protein [Falsiroseomonas oryzae]|uniref:YncE family protein n=1 Tax=Falsiroseomonas oryzae TaxID=2766473 RepID=UPI0022EB40D4|nr:YncE family protein [Roseomonas sp. MO-31]
MNRFGWLAGAALLASAMPASAQIAVSANDAKAVLVNGATRIAPEPRPDTISILDLGTTPPRLVGHVEAPASVVGPPTSVAVTPDERLAIVTSNQRLDPANPSRTVPDTRVSVVDLRATPPGVVQTVEAGRGPAGLSVNRAGTLALVANREAGTVSVFRIRDARLEAVGTVEIGPANAGVSHVAFTPDGRHALVTRDGDFMISVLAIEGETVRRLDRTISAGLRPYGVAIAPHGRWAAVANIGRGNGDADTISLIDLTGEVATWRVVHTITVGQTPEGIKASPDGRTVAVTVMNGSNKPANSPFHGPGLVRTYRVEEMRFVPAGEARVGTWSQGAAFSRDGRTLLVGNMVERNIQVFAVAPDGALRESAPAITVPGGSAALRTADR